MDNITPKDILTPAEYENRQVPETYQGTTDGFWDSVGNEIARESYGIAGTTYNLGAWVGTKLGATNYFKDDQGGFNFSDRMRANQIELQYSHPNPIVTDVTSAATTIASIAVPIAGEASLASLGIKLPALAGSAEALEGGVKSGAIKGIARRLGVYEAMTTPLNVGDSVYYNKDGHATIDTSKFFKLTGEDMAMFGAFEGAGAAYRRITTTLKGQISNSAKNLSKMAKGKEEPSPLKTETLSTVRPEAQPIEMPEESQNATTVDSLVDSTFTPEQKKQILSDTKKVSVQNKELESDLRLTDDGTMDYNSLVTPAITGTARRQLIQAILSKHGVMLEGTQKHLDDALAVAKITDTAKNLRTYWKLSGVRKVLLNAEYEKARSKLKDTAELDRLDKELFTTMSYRNKGSLQNPDSREEFLSASSRGHEAPLWFRELKSGEENLKAQAELREMADKGSEAAKYLHGLVEESNLKKHDGYRMHLLDSIDDTIDNHLPIDEAEKVIESARNGEGIFGPSELDEEIDSMTKDLLAQKGVKFLDENPQNIFFTKTIKKMQDNLSASEAYISCLIGA